MEGSVPQQAAEFHGKKSAQSNFVPCLANFNILYNYTSATMAVTMITNQEYLGYPLYKEPQWADDVALASVFVGSIVGMLFMGRLGDLIPRWQALKITLIFVMFGVLIPACSVGPPNVSYAIITLGRFVVGVGLGGIYPLSAVISAESADDNHETRVGWAYFWQTPGSIAPYPVALILLSVVPQMHQHEEWVTQIQFRALLLIGALPTAVILVSSFRKRETRCHDNFHRQRSFFDEITHASFETQRNLLGCVATWFALDVNFYGTNIFLPRILSSMCMGGHVENGRCNQSLFTLTWQSCLVSSMGIPGILAAVHTLDIRGIRFLNTVGFLLLVVLFVAAALMDSLNLSQTYASLGLMCLLQLALNYGPNLGVFVAPAVCFERRVRTTFHGVASCGGKVGALFATLMFPFVNASFGLAGVFWIQAIVSILGAICSIAFLKIDRTLMTGDIMSQAHPMEKNLLSTSTTGPEAQLHMH